MFLRSTDAVTRKSVLSAWQGRRGLFLIYKDRNISRSNYPVRFGKLKKSASFAGCRPICRSNAAFNGDFIYKCLRSELQPGSEKSVWFRGTTIVGPLFIDM